MSKKYRNKEHSILDRIQIEGYTDEDVLYRGLNLLTIEEIKNLSTERLLSYYRKHVQRLPYLIANWGRCDCCGERLEYDDNDRLRFRSWDIAEKITERYKEEVKKVLGNREHIE